LGDDIVIADALIAAQYAKIIKALGIEISMSKSFIMRHLAEFAKGWYLKGVDLKPLSPEWFTMDGRKSLSRVVELAEALSRKRHSIGGISLYRRLFPRLPVQSFVTLCVIRGCTHSLGVVNTPKVMWDTFLAV